MNVGLALLLGYLVLAVIALTVNHLIRRDEPTAQADAEQIAAISKH